MRSQTGPAEVYNRDIWPSAALAAAYAGLKPLIINQDAADAFRLKESEANRWKNLHNRLGGTALICIMLVMLLFDYQITLRSFYELPEAVIWLGELIALVGLGTQLSLWSLEIKEKWVLNRFAAERIRCIKFQAFLLLCKGVGLDDLPLAVREFTTEKLGLLDQELMGGRMALLEFNPAEAFSVASAGSGAFAQGARDVYDTLRFEIQTQHFDNQSKVNDELARLPAAASEAAFALGALLAFLQIAIGTNLAGVMGVHIANLAEAWVHFLALMMFVLSAVIAVYQRGSARQQHAERYTNYGREVRRLRMLAQRVPSSEFPGAVQEMEQLALRELHDFCRDARQSSYIF